MILNYSEYIEGQRETQLAPDGTAASPGELRGTTEAFYRRSGLCPFCSVKAPAASDRCVLRNVSVPSYRPIQGGDLFGELSSRRFSLGCLGFPAGWPVREVPASYQCTSARHTGPSGSSTCAFPSLPAAKSIRLDGVEHERHRPRRTRSWTVSVTSSSCFSSPAAPRLAPAPPPSPKRPRRLRRPPSWRSIGGATRPSIPRRSSRPTPSPGSGWRSSPRDARGAPGPSPSTPTRP